MIDPSYFPIERGLYPEYPWVGTTLSPIDWYSKYFQNFIHSKGKVLQEAVKYEFGEGPNKAGVYFLLLNGVIVYIGKSDCIYKRLIQHFDAEVQFDSYWCFGNIPDILIHDVEGFYIHLIQPVFNTKYPYLEEVSKKYLESRGIKVEPRQL